MKLIITLLLATLMCQEQEFNRFKAYNGIEFEYKVLIPADYSSRKNYELAIVFTEVEKIDNVYKETLNGLSSQRFSNMIIILPKVPIAEPHWKSHPVHHGLNDLMDNLRKKYGHTDQLFHFISYKEGHNVAQAYASMSHQYVDSFSIVHSTYWPKDKQEYFNTVTNKKAPIFIYEPMEKDTIKLDLSKTTYTQVSNWIEAFNLIDQRVTIQGK